jgi:hypothetical protein
MMGVGKEEEKATRIEEGGGRAGKGVRASPGFLEY